MKTLINRRTAIRSMFAAAAMAATPRLFAGKNTLATDIGSVANYIYPNVSWSHVELNEFLEVLPDSGLISMQKSLELIPHDVAKTTVEDRPTVLTQIQKQMLWNSNHIVSYPFRDEKKIDYHDLTKWVGSEMGVDSWILDTQPTLVVERAIQEKLLIDIWDKLSPDERRTVLANVDPKNSIEGHAAIAALSGAGAIAALSMTVQLAGFAFYTTMSTVICTAAGFFGVTLPFAAYAGAASTVAFLSGPVGWAFLAIAAAAGTALAGRADVRKTAAAICQMHSLKVAALQAAGQDDGNVFKVMGDPVKRQLVGRWKINGKRETINLLMHSDGEFTADCFEVLHDKTASPSVKWQGKGHWSVRDRSLSIKRTHSWNYLYWSENPRELYSNRSVVEITPTRILLAADACLERI